MLRRRTIRRFSDRPVPRAIVEDALLAAGSARSGANPQPWYFVALGDPAIKSRIREAAEREERALYEERATREWLEALATLTHTPSPMWFLNEILGRPANERPFLLLVTGYPHTDAEIPVITKKGPDTIATFV